MFVTLSDCFRYRLGVFIDLTALLGGARVFSLQIRSDFSALRQPNAG
ncbi:hypothetical protein CCP3SC1_1170006 [Gammaproteobacteria bacterium]